MPEPQSRESLGSRLLAAGQPQVAAWNRYKTRMEETMAEVETRTRKFKRLRWIPLSVSIVLIVLATVFLVRFGEETGDLTRQVSLGVGAIMMFLMATLFIVQYHIDRVNLEIRRDIKELTLAVIDLKEGLTKAQ